MSVNQAPLSVRNNNPGNLRFVGQEGASQGEGGFAKFETPEAGLAAMRNQIELDTQTRGLNLTEFLNKYAPPSENKTSNYIDFVVKRTGLDPAARVPVERIADLQKAMIEMEGGPRALSAFNMAVPPRTTAQKVAAPGTRTTVQAAKPAVQVAAAINPSELPSNYTSALALSYLSDTDPEGKIMGRVNEMLEEMQGGAAKPPGGATLQKFAQSERVDPFKLMAQAQQEEEPKQRKAVPRMPVKMATGGPVGEMSGTQATEVDGFANGGLAARALAANRPRLTETDYTKLKGIQSEFEDYNKRVEDYQKSIDAYNAKVEAYNAAGGEGVENPGEFTTAEPTAPGTTVEQAEAFKKEAEERAKRFYAARSTALQSIVNPEKYNLSGMSFGFEKGGEVNIDQQQAEFNATQDMDEYRKKSQEMLYNLRTNLGPVTGQFVPGRQGVDVRASTQVAGVRPFVDVNPNEMAVTRFGASYGRMGPQGGYDVTVEQPAAVPTPAGPVNLPPSLRGVYAQPLGKDGTFAVEGMYSPGPNPQYRVGARLIKRFEYGGMANANPADIAEQMTVGTLPADQTPAGQVFTNIGRDVVRGAQYLPYDLLGAPVDIATMAMRPFGYNVEKPVGGSEYLIEKARQAGIAQAPTGSAAETATRIGMGFVNPAAVARQIPKGIAAIEKGAETLGTGAVRAITGKPDITPEQIYQAVGDTRGIMQLGAPAVVRPLGSAIDTSSEVDKLLRASSAELKPLTGTESPRVTTNLPGEVDKYSTIEKVVVPKLENYLTRQFGTINDPLLEATVSGKFLPKSFYRPNDVFSFEKDGIVRLTGIPLKGEKTLTMEHINKLRELGASGNQEARKILSKGYDISTYSRGMYTQASLLDELKTPEGYSQTHKYLNSIFSTKPEYIDRLIKGYIEKKGVPSKDLSYSGISTSYDQVPEESIFRHIEASVLNQKTQKAEKLIEEQAGKNPVLSKFVVSQTISPNQQSIMDYVLNPNMLEELRRGKPVYTPTDVYGGSINYGDIADYVEKTPVEKWSKMSIPELVLASYVNPSNVTKPSTIARYADEGVPLLPFQKLMGTKDFMPVKSQVLGNGAEWREITTRDGLRIEGGLLKHCLKKDEFGYCNRLMNKESKYFTLRDADGQPYATIEMSKPIGLEDQDVPFNVIKQVKGMSNESVIPLYGEEVTEFLTAWEKQIGTKLRPAESSDYLPLKFKPQEFGIKAPPENMAQGGMVDKPLYDRAA